MPEKKSLLDQIDAESQLKDGDSPFKRKEKQNHYELENHFTMIFEKLP